MVGPGSVLGTNIVLERAIGSGAMGTVWLGENRSLHSKVAVKILHRSLSDDEHALARFQQEARAVANLDSPHVVKIFDFGTTPEQEPFIVMELLDGRDLRQVIEEDGPLSPALTAEIVRQLCRALGRAHDLDIIHRDIKPANVFVVESDGEPFVKVLDFGIARYLTESSLNMTTTGTVLGTPYYMSPEQFVDPRNIDRRSDLWSVAVVAYGCLLGRLPFLGETIGALSLAVHSGRYPLPSEVNPALPAALDAFFLRALSVSPHERYATAAELATALGAAVGSAPSSLAPHLAGHAASVVGPAAAFGTAGSPASLSASHAAPLATGPAPFPPPPAGPAPAAGYPNQGALPALGPSAAVIAPTPGAFAQPTYPPQPLPPPQPATTPKAGSPWPWIVAAGGLVGLGIFGAALVLPGAGGAEGDKAQAKVEREDEAGAKKSKKKKKGKKTSSDDAPSKASAAPDPAPEPAPTPAPSAAPTSEPSASQSAPPPAPPPSPPLAPKPAPLR